MEPLLSSASSPSIWSPSSPMQPGKLFVGGLAWETTDDDLLDYFSKYGDVVSAKVVMSMVTGRSRGFAFVCLADPTVAKRLIEDKPHLILGTEVDVKIALPRGEVFGYGNIDRNYSNKIFVGGLPCDLTKEELKRYFENFGSVTDAIIMYDSSGIRSRGFGFVTFKSEESVDKVTKNDYYMLKSKRVQVKRTQPRGSNHSSDNNADLINYPGEIYPMSYSVGGLSHFSPQFSPYACLPSYEDFVRNAWNNQYQAPQMHALYPGYGSIRHSNFLRPAVTHRHSQNETANQGAHHSS